MDKKEIMVSAAVFLFLVTITYKYWSLVLLATAISLVAMLIFLVILVSNSIKE